jgi:hypothetical protein
VSDSQGWVKSSYSASGNCVEVATLPDGRRIVRDSKNHAGSRLTFSAEQWHKFAASLKG